MTDHVIDTETVDTDAGEYVVSFVYDEGADPPYNEGLGFAFDGGRDCIDVANGEHADEVLSLVRYHRKMNAYNGNIYDTEIRSSAAIARYLRLIYGFKGVRIIDSGYGTDKPSSDRGADFAGIAWAPDDVPEKYDGNDDYPSTYTDLGIAEYRAWAEGDCFGYVVTGPDGAELDDGALWGFYGFDESREYALSQARDVIDSDAVDRVKNANVVGAGIVGLI